MPQELFWNRLQNPQNTLRRQLRDLLQHEQLAEGMADAVVIGLVGQYGGHGGLFAAVFVRVSNARPGAAR